MIHNEKIRQPLVLELGEHGAGIPLFDTGDDAEAFLAAMLSLGVAWEVVELSETDMADGLQGFVGDPIDEDERAIDWVILNPPPWAGQEVGVGLRAYLVGFREYAKTLRTPER